MHGQFGESVKMALGDFRELKSEVVSLHAILCTLQKLKVTFGLTAGLQDQLSFIEQGCLEVLEFIEKEMFSPREFRHFSSSSIT